MRKILLFPSWALFLFARIFLPKNHPFKIKEVNSTDWHKKFAVTDIAITFSAIMWINFFSLIFVLILIFF